MSYGWLTESALLPKPGKDIDSVPAHSLTTLRSVVLETQETRKRERQRNAGVDDALDILLKRSGNTKLTRPTKKKRSFTERLFEGKNAKVEMRDAADAARQAAESKSFAASRKKLEEKAQLYDRLKKLEFCVAVCGTSEIVNEDLEASLVALKEKKAGLCLDVERKQKEAAAARPPSCDDIACGSSIAEKIAAEPSPPQPDSESLVKKALRERLQSRKAQKDA